MNAGIYPSYQRRFSLANRRLKTYRERHSAYLHDRVGGAHFLGPVLAEEEWATFTIGNDPVLQGMWAQENGISKIDAENEVLRNQIENHRTEVFYNLDPLRFGSKFLRTLPGCVKYKLCWRAAPSPGADFGGYDRVMCNFPGILKTWEKEAWNTALFFPAHDAEMDIYAANENRPIDICFVGGFSRHHSGRAAVLEAIGRLRHQYEIRYHLDISRVTRIAEHPVAAVLPMRQYRRSKVLRTVSKEPVFGRSYYELLGDAKIVLNGAIDMAGVERGNMRCFEAMGCGALLLSDAGDYPDGMDNAVTMLTYTSPSDAIDRIAEALDGRNITSTIAANGHQMVKKVYSKEKQWDEFLRVISEI